MDTSILKNNKIIVIVMIIMFFAFTNVDADSCSGKTKNNLINEGNKIEFIPVLNDEYNPMHEYSYKVNITNLSEKFYILDSNGNRYEYEESYNDDSVFGMYKPGSEITLNVYGSYESDCEDEILTTRRIRFDYYNDYSTYKECEGIEEFYLCKRNYSGKIESEEWFLNQVKGYKDGIVENIPVEEEVETDENLINKELVIVIVVILLIGIVIFIIVLKIKSSKKIKIKFRDIKDGGVKNE